jgi:glyoxylase-like metal-dependent hydrolase (beta-lactamase superfamily II)
VSHDVIAVLQRVAALTRHWGASFETDIRVSSGSTISLRDRVLRVVHAPGHSPSDTLYFDERRRIMFGGDHLLADISSNALVSGNLPGSRSEVRRRSLIDYLASLVRTRALPIDVLLPGHGRAVTDHRDLIDERLAHHQSRAEVILEVVRRQPVSAHEIAAAIWGDVAITQAYLTLSEVLGHLDLLTRDHLVEEIAGPMIRFAAL